MLIAFILSLLSNIPILKNSKTFLKFVYSFGDFLKKLRKDQIITVVIILCLTSISILWNVKQHFDIERYRERKVISRKIHKLCEAYIKSKDGKIIRFIEFDNFIESNKFELIRKKRTDNK